MEHAEDPGVSATTVPVFVDDTGRRRKLTRRVGRLLVIGLAGHLGLLAAGFTRDPRLGPVALPTFGLPALHPDPAPVVGETTARTAADATGDGADPATSGAETASGAGLPSGSAARGFPSGGAGAGQPGGGVATGTGSVAGAAQAGVPAGGQASTTTTTSTTITSAPVHPGHGPKSTTTTTSAPSSPPTSSTTTTTAATPGQGSGPASAKGPDGEGPPGRDRVGTTATGPRR